MKIDKFKFLVFFSVVYTISIGSGAAKDETEFNFSKKINYKGKKPCGITITERETATEIELSEDEIGKVLRDAGKIRKEKEKTAHITSPLVPSKVVSFTSNVSGKRETVEHPVYVIQSKEDKRRFRNIIQKFYDDSNKARKEDTDKPSPLIIQRGLDEENDMVILRPGLDIAAAPLRKSSKAVEGYVATQPPAYGDAVDEAPQAFKKILKLVEGVRSTSATPLRHIAEIDKDFIGKDKGGAKKLRNYDKGKATKKDEEKILRLVGDIFIKTAKTEKTLVKGEVLKKLKDVLATETDSPSFSKINSNKKKVKVKKSKNKKTG